MELGDNREWNQAGCEGGTHREWKTRGDIQKGA